MSALAAGVQLRCEKLKGIEVGLSRLARNQSNGQVGETERLKGDGWDMVFVLAIFHCAHQLTEWDDSSVAADAVTLLLPVGTGRSQG